MFKGFNLKYPEYEVFTPQTRMTFTVRTLTVQEEERLKGSLLSPMKVTDHLNKCIFENLVIKPDKITDFKSFLQNVTLKDRDALLYGIYHITYEDIRNYDIKCAECKKDYQVTIKASETFNLNQYPSDDILSKVIKIPLKTFDTVTVFLRQPTLYDESEAIKQLTGSMGYSLEILIETLIISKMTQDIEAIIEPVEITDRGSIIDAYRSLPAKDKRLIYDKYTEEFGKYNVELKMKSYCTHCGKDEVINIDLVENFFRMVYTS